MPQNVEIKARVRDLAALENAAAQVADGGDGGDGQDGGGAGRPAGMGEVLEQHDVFFASPRGRLKLRMVNDRAQLIYYERADEAGPKTSTFSIAPVGDFAAMRETLGLALETLGEVKKRRRLYLVGQTRVHVDSVEGLGDFMELEVCMRDGQSVDEAQGIARQLMVTLGIEEADLITGAYTDMLKAKAEQAKKST